MGDDPYTAISSNIVPRVFPQVAADNTDSNLDNLDRNIWFISQALSVSRQNCKHGT